MKTMQRIMRWSVTEDGVIQFRYEIDDTQFLFCVTRQTMADVLRDIGRLAANPKSPISWNDAAYLTSMIREVVDMLEPQTVDADDSNVLIGNDVYSIAWTILMVSCSCVITLAAMAFVMWGM